MAGLHIKEYKIQKVKKTEYWLEAFVCFLLISGFTKVFLSGFPQVSSFWWIYSSGCILLSWIFLGLDHTKIGDWSFPLGFGIVFIIFLFKNRDFRNGVCVLGNEWLDFLTGVTGKIYLDFPVESEAGVYLVVALFLALLTLCLVWNVKRKRLHVFSLLLIICMAGLISNFFRLDWGFILLVVGMGCFLFAQKIEIQSWKSLSAAFFGFAGTMIICGVVSSLIGACMKFDFSTESSILKIKSAVHKMRYDSGEDAMTDGNLVNVGSFEKNDEIALVLTAEDPQKLYLRGMIGEIYTGCSWETLGEDARREGESLFYWLHKSGFYGQNSIGQAMSLKGEAEVTSLTIENRSACSKYRYLPYGLSEKETLAENLVGDDVNPASETMEELDCYTGSVPQWYETALWISENQNKESVNEYLTKEQSYREFIYDNDLQLTNTAVGVMERIFKSNEESRSLSEILELVKSTLDEKLEYRESTVTYNGNNDFFQYTMEQSKSGYSVHYATAATLMLRYFGVPARYVEGYYLSAEEASKYKAGDEILLREGHAHAWTEYYLDGIGWIPFEVTPGYIDEEELQVVSQTIADGLGEGNGKSYQHSALTYKPPKHPEKNENVSDWNNRFRFQTKYLATGILMILLLLLLFALFCILRRRKRLYRFYREIEEADNRNAIIGLYSYGMMLLNKKGISQPEDGEEISKINQEARFSSHTMQDIQRQKVKIFTQNIIQKCRKDSSIWNRFRDHYIFWLYR